MAIARNLVAAPKNLLSLRYFLRRITSSPTSIAAVDPHLNFAEKPIEIKTPILDLNDGEKLFSSMSTGKLIRSSLNLHVAAVEPMVDFGMWVMKSKIMETPVLRKAILGLIKHTFYEHFCAGENTAEVVETMRKLNAAGLRGMLVYALEDTADNASCDRNLEAFLQTVDVAKSLPPSSVSFVIVKITAICPMNLLHRVSDLLRWQHQNPSTNLPWKHNHFPLFSKSSPMYHTLEKPEPLTQQEEEELQQAQERLFKLCQRCQEVNIPLSVDAEYTSVQPAIDYFTYSSAIMYNKDESKPLVYGTMQTYLKDSRDRLLVATKAAEKMGVPMGFKLVRGAYMSSESQIASSLGYDSPVHNSIGETHACYNGCASFMLEKVASGSSAVVLASHNVDSGKMAAKKARDLGIGKGNRRLEFAQLYGMSEGLSFGLSNAGFLVSKYMPFGPVEKVMPYLLRRAEENRGLLSASNLDRQLLRKEMMRRLNAAIF